MTVPVQTPSQSSTGNGVTTVFPYNFRILAEDELLVEVDGLAYTLNVDYTLSGVGDLTGGNITFAVAPVNGAVVHRERAMQFKRDTDYQTGGDLLALVINRDIDAVVMMIQQVKAGIDTVFADGETVGFYQHPGLGSILRTANAKMAELASVTDFGAVGDGATDDTLAFEAAFAAAYRVFVPPGLYLLDNCNVPSNTEIFGEGPNSVISPFSAAAPQLVMRVDANENIEIHHLSFNVNKTTYPTKECLWGQGCTNIYVHHCTFDQAGKIAVHFVDSTDCCVERCRISNVAVGGIVFGGTLNVSPHIIGNVVGAAGSTLQGISVECGTRALIAHNKVNASGVFGIQMHDCLYSEMVNNTTFNTTREGCNASDSSYCTIQNNVVFWDDTTSTDFGISIGDDTEAGVQNLVSNNVVVNAGKSGIAIAGVAFANSGNQVIGNKIYNCNRDNAANGAGVHCYGQHVADTVVQGNYVFDNVGTLKYGYLDESVMGGAPTGTILVGNTFVGFSTARVLRNTGHEALNGRPWNEKTWVPTVAPSAGAFGVAPTVHSAYYWEIEKVTHFRFTIENTNNGTGATDIAVTLPYASSANGPFVAQGSEAGGFGGALSCRIAVSAASVRVRKYDGGYPWGTGSTIDVQGCFERA